MPFATAAGHRLEYVWLGPPPGAAPTLVFLHEGLGSVSLWRSFPEKLASATGCGALVYSRWGYGKSDPVTLPRPLTYMHDEAQALPELLKALGVRDVILVGHSDGASIALIYAGSEPLAGLRGLVLEAPHVFAEDLSVRSIAKAAKAYETGGLRVPLARHHDDPDGAFWGWNRAWRDPEFRKWNLEEFLPRIHVPVLVIQGEKDEYGTVRQIEAIHSGCKPRVQIALIPKCGHSPHRDQPELTLNAMVGFIRSTIPSPAGGRGSG
jgi:pimeloyl-ACP methyl ester carboxylesterase